MDDLVNYAQKLVSGKHTCCVYNCPQSVSIVVAHGGYFCKRHLRELESRDNPQCVRPSLCTDLACPGHSSQVRRFLREQRGSTDCL